MSGGQPVEADVGQVEQAGQHGGRDADGKHVPSVIREGSGRIPQPHAQRRFAGSLPVSGQQINAGCPVGQGGRDGRAGDLLAAGQQDEHKQRVQNAVEDAAGAQTDARFSGIAGVPEQVGQGGGKDGRQTADHDHDQGIAPGKADGLIRRAEKSEQRVQEQAGQG